MSAPAPSPTWMPFWASCEVAPIPVTIAFWMLAVEPAPSMTIPPFWYPETVESESRRCPVCGGLAWESPTRIPTPPWQPFRGTAPAATICDRVNRSVAPPSTTIPYRAS